MKSSGIQKKSCVQPRLDPRISTGSRRSQIKTTTKSRVTPKRVGNPKKSRIQTRMVGGQMVRVNSSAKSDSPKKWKQNPKRMEKSPKKSRVQTIINARASPNSIKRGVQSTRERYKSRPRIKRIKLPPSSSAKQISSPDISWRIVPKSQDRKESNHKSPPKRRSSHRKSSNSSSPSVIVLHRNSSRSQSGGKARGEVVSETSFTKCNKSPKTIKSRSPSQSTSTTQQKVLRESQRQSEGESIKVGTKQRPCTVSVLKERLVKVDQAVGELKRENTEKSLRLDFLEWEIKKLVKQLDKKTTQNLSLESKNNAIRPRAMTTSLERDVRREMRENQLEWDRVFENKNLEPDYRHHTWTRKDEEENQPEILTAEEGTFL